MSYLIGTKKDCQTYDNYVSDKIGLEGYNWAQPRKHPTQNIYAILVHEIHTPQSGEVVSELDESWTQNDEII